MSPSNSLTYLLDHLAAVLSRRSEELLQEQLDIGLSQFRILMALEWNPRASQRAVADSLGLTEAGVSRQVKLLVSKGMLASKADPVNRRRHVIAPTPRGMQVTEAAAALLRRDSASGLAGFGNERLASLAAELQSLHALVCRPGKQGSCNHGLGL
jgi:DNA-binding MarR family transcriptional regulator